MSLLTGDKTIKQLNSNNVYLYIIHKWKITTKCKQTPGVKEIHIIKLKYYTVFSLQTYLNNLKNVENFADTLNLDMYVGRAYIAYSCNRPIFEWTKNSKCRYWISF